MANRLIEIIAALRSPGSGCAWDLEQTFETIAPFTIEESYEIADAVARGDMNNLKEDLGICFFKLFFTPASPRSADSSDFGGVVEAITQQMLRGTARGLSPDEVKTLWEKRIKRDEKKGRDSAGPASSESILAGVPLALPGLTRAVKLQAKASTVGFDWNDARLVIEKYAKRPMKSRPRSTPGMPPRSSRKSAIFFSVPQSCAPCQSRSGRCHPPGQRQVRTAIPLHRGGAGTRRHGAWRRGIGGDGRALEPSEARRKARNWGNEIWLSMALG